MDRKLVFKALAAVALAAPLVLAGCTSSEQPQEEPEPPKTLRDEAEAVGRFSDRVRTSNMEKSLTDMVDSAEEEAKRLEEANKLSDE